MTFSKETLKTVREYRSWTQKELAAHAGLSQQQGLISKIENGTIIPSEEQIIAITNALKFPKQFFYETSIPNSGLAFHRKRASLPAKVCMQLEAEAKLRKVIISKLIDYDCRPNLLDEKFQSKNSPKEAAQELRKKWKLKPGRINNLIETVEGQGIFVIKHDFGTPQLDGFFMHGSPCCLFLNAEVSNDRLRFSIAHELGHLVLQHNIPGEAAEKEANDFAAEFLLPETDIIDDFSQRLSIERLAELKKKWHSSMASILFRAKELGSISQSNATRLWTELSFLGFKKQEPALGIPDEKPSMIKKILQLTYGNQINYNELSIRFNINEGDLRHCLNGI